jgi:1,2-dihydroxy-3-keto-5-methylthiopentene dioxygenase
MTTLAAYSEEDTRVPVLVTTDGDQIRSLLAQVGIEFERWKTDEHVAEKDAPERILGAYRSWIEDLKRRGGYATADVIALTPDHPERMALRQKFLDEHIHTEDEVRFFVAGRGAFYLHIGGRVWVIVCERGDLIRVPARTLHWFDMGPEPSLVAIRVFTNPAGWVAEYSGDGIAARYPRLEPGGLPIV